MISTIVGLVIGALIIIIGHLTGALDFRAAVEIMLERLEEEENQKRD
jgi:hypothetical protein